MDRATTINPEGKSDAGECNPHFPAIAHDLNELVETAAQFSTIYADPPWQYSNTAARGAAVNHYPTMDLNELCELPVAQLASPNAHLHLWTTNGFLPDAFRVIEAWGFTYK